MGKCHNCGMKFKWVFHWILFGVIKVADCAVIIKLKLNTNNIPSWAQETIGFRVFLPLRVLDFPRNRFHIHIYIQPTIQKQFGESVIAKTVNKN